MDMSAREKAKQKSVEIFCCYAREDLPLLLELKRHLMPLVREKLITLWADTDIGAGDDWEKEIHYHLNTAEIILLFVSPAFMASDYCYSIEMQQSLMRYERKEAHIIPIILRPVSWQRSPFSRIQALPVNAAPVTSGEWHDRDEAFLNIAEGIRDVVEKRLAEFSSLSHPPVPRRKTVRESLLLLRTLLWVTLLACASLLNVLTWRQSSSTCDFENLEGMGTGVLLASRTVGPTCYHPNNLVKINIVTLITSGVIILLSAYFPFLKNNRRGELLSGSIFYLMGMTLFIGLLVNLYYYLSSYGLDITAIAHNLYDSLYGAFFLGASAGAILLGLLVIGRALNPTIRALTGTASLFMGGGIYISELLQSSNERNLLFFVILVGAIHILTGIAFVGFSFVEFTRQKQ